MDIFTKEKRSQIMSRIKSESSIEVLPKSLKGLYLRKHPKCILGKPDFGNKSRKVVVFIDGCFWHMCPKHKRVPKSNRKFWFIKLKSNVKRDKYVVRVLKREGWQVIRIWECQLKKMLKKESY